MADILASVSVVLGAEVSGFKAAMADARKDLRGLVQAGEAARDIGKSLTTYVSAPLALLGAASLKVGGDFQAAFNRVESATQATGAALASLRDKAQGIALDPNLKFSSVQAAEALEALAKNGMSTGQILGGAADASTALATATGGGLATAADITTDVMNNFGKSAADAAGLVSNITGTTIASKFAIDDYRLALGQAGAVAGQLGVKFEDFNTALGITSSGFSSGSDAGTSFKTFLQRLVPQTKEAAGAMQQLGLNFFDAQGQMRPLREIAGQLQQAFKGLSDEQRNALGTKIFGADSIRTALLLAKDGVKGFDEMAASIGKVNAAAQGAILNKGFVGAFESFKSSVEGLGQAIAENGILDFATAFAQQGAAIAASLAQADPAVLKLGVALAAVAAATGPLLVAVGSLGVALPALEAGFAVLAGPVGLAVGAFALLGVGTAALVARSAAAAEGVEQVSQRFAAQTSAVQQLQATYLPLLTRYDELKAKSRLSATEQEELRSIIEKVGAQIPTAITRFDAYGKALDISTEAGRGFIRQQVLINEQLNKDQLTVQRARYRELTTGIEETAAALALLVKQQQIRAADYGALTQRPDFNIKDQQNYQFALAQSGQQVQDLQAKLLNLKTTREGVGGLIDQLKGLPPVVKAAGDETGKLGEKLGQLAGLNVVSEASQKMQDALAKLRQELAVNDNLSRALGLGFDYVGGRTKILEGGVKSLIEVGFSPLGRTVQGIVADMRSMATEVDQLTGRVAKGLENMGKTPEFKLNVPEFEKAPDLLLPNYEAMFGNAAAGVVKGKGALEQELGSFSQAQADFNTNTEGLIAAFPGDAFAAIGESIGQSLANGTDVLQGIFASVLGVVADFMKSYGKQLILLGVGDIAVGNVGKGLLELAAGTALIAGAGFASATASATGAGSTSVASAPKLNASTSAASTPRSYTPTTAPTAAAGPSTITHKVEMTLDGRNLKGALDLQLDRLGRIRG